MSFVYQNYLLIIVIFLVVYASIVIKQENKFYDFVERFWFKRRSFLSHVSRFLFLVGFSLLVLSLLDLRGPEERIKAQVPSKRTIILIDTSASMLAEDVRPSRLEKAVLLAKHFARKAVGHQISVIVFSEIQKKIIPFTADLDLIDSRLESIKGLKNQYGTSALSSAIQEAIQSFKESGDEPRGNILVLTDGEETAEGIDLIIPEDMHIALVGIGTKNGGRIPLDDKSGMRYGYKLHRGKEVVTKLNEDFFRSITNKYPQTKSWIADTYALPSDEIVAFFDTEHMKGIENQDMVIRPVLMQWLVVPGILFLVLSYGLKMIKVFAILSLILMQPLWAQEQPPEKPLPAQVLEGLGELQKGRLSKDEKLGLAYELQKNEYTKEALKLYEEEIEYLKAEQKFNYGTALLSDKKFAEGFSTYKEILDDENVSPDLKEKVAKNALYFLRSQQSEKEQQKKDQEKKQEKEDQKGESQDSSDSKSSEGQSKSDDQNQNNDSQEENKEKDQQRDNKSGDKDDEEKDGKDEKDESQNDGEEREKLPPKKLPAKLKQLMSDDRKLQMEMIERGTKDMNKRKSNTSKDW